jgi:TRAP-type C4-dicarboxylate transport system permease small subunit
MYPVLSKAAEMLARAMALIGGAILIGLVVLTCISIAGRALLGLGLGFQPIWGIFDMTEIGIAAAIFAFLPWCQLQRGHAAVDLFKPVYPDGMNRLLDLLIDMAMCAAASILAWRLFLGMLDKQRFTETTLILQFPVWQAYLACLIGAVAFALVAAFCVLRSGRALIGLDPEVDLT